MGNPKGSNAGTVGVKGKSGRKSAYQELADATKLVNAFEKGINVADLEKILIKLKNKKGKIKLREWAFLRAFKSDRVLCDLLRKVYSDKTDNINKHEGEGLAGLLVALHASGKKEQLPEKPPKKKSGKIRKKTKKK